MAKRTKLADGSYTRNGERFVVKDGMMEKVSGGPAARVASEAPPTPNTPPGYDPNDWKWKLRDKLVAGANAATAGIMGLADPDQKPDLERVAGENPGSALVGSMVSPINRIPGGGGVLGAAGRVALRGAAGASYANSVGQNPYVGGLTAGALAGAGESVANSGAFAPKLAGFLKDKFGQYMPSLESAVPSTEAGTVVGNMGKYGPGLTENGTMVGQSALEKIGNGVDSVGQWLGNLIGKSSVPASEALSNPSNEKEAVEHAKLMQDDPAFRAKVRDE